MTLPITVNSAEIKSILNCLVQKNQYGNYIQVPHGGNYTTIGTFFQFNVCFYEHNLSGKKLWQVHNKPCLTEASNWIL